MLNYIYFFLNRWIKIWTFASLWIYFVVKVILFWKQVKRKINIINLLFYSHMRRVFSESKLYSVEKSTILIEASAVMCEKYFFFFLRTHRIVLSFEKNQNMITRVLTTEMHLVSSFHSHTQVTCGKQLSTIKFNGKNNFFIYFNSLIWFFCHLIYQLNFLIFFLIWLFESLIPKLD